MGITVLILSISCLSYSAHFGNVGSHGQESGWRDPEDQMEFATVPNWRNQIPRNIKRRHLCGVLRW